MRHSAVAVSGAIITLVSSVATVAPASAAEIQDAFTNVTVTSDQAVIGEVINITAAWQVPNNTSAGSTFTLTVPEQLRILTADFEIHAQDGEVIATATASGNTITVTLTDYVKAHPRNITGNLKFSARISNGVKEGESITFNWGKSSTEIKPEAAKVPGQVTETRMYSWPSQGQEAGWAIDVPGWQSEVTVSASLDSGTFQCESLDARIGDQTQGYPEKGAFVKASPYSLDCTETGFTLVFSEVPAGQLLHVAVNALPAQGSKDISGSWSVDSSLGTVGNAVSVTTYEAGGSGSAEEDQPYSLTGDSAQTGAGSQAASGSSTDQAQADTNAAASSGSVTNQKTVGGEAGDSQADSKAGSGTSASGQVENGKSKQDKLYAVAGVGAVVLGSLIWYLLARRRLKKDEK